MKDREDAVTSERFSLPPFEAVHDLEFDAFCLASPEARELLVIAAEGNHRAPSTLMQGFRELALLDHQSQGAVVLHAAALERDGEAVLILAPKGGGKTTLLARALLAGARLVSNDRAVVARTQEGFAVVGVPTVIFLHRDTLDLVPGMRAHFEEPRRDFRRRLRQIDEPGIRRISPGQFCELTQSTAVREATIRKIIFLVDGSGKAVSVNSPEATERLERCMFDFTQVEKYFFASLAPLDRASFQESAHQVCSTLCQEVTSWQVPREAREAGLPYLF